MNYEYKFTKLKDSRPKNVYELCVEFMSGDDDIREIVKHTFNREGESVILERYYGFYKYFFKSRFDEDDYSEKDLSFMREFVFFIGGQEDLDYVYELTDEYDEDDEFNAFLSYFKEKEILKRNFFDCDYMAKIDAIYIYLYNESGDKFKVELIEK